MNNEQRRRANEEDELVLVLWYQRQRGHRTMKTDAQIAAELDWTITRRRRQSLNAQGILTRAGAPDADRVQRTRRRIDKNDDQWAGYHFGTRGSLGRFTSSLSCDETLEEDEALPVTKEHVKGQVFREFQRVRHAEAELKREVGKFLKCELLFHELGEHELATTCAMIASDLSARSQSLVSPNTLARLVEQGLS